MPSRWDEPFVSEHENILSFNGRDGKMQYAGWKNAFINPLL